MNTLGAPSAPGLLSSDKAKACAEAGGFCFEHNGHASGVRMRVEGDVAVTHEVHWPSLTTPAYPAWADLQEAAEEGATGVAMLLVQEETGLVPALRAPKGTGIDYWLTHPLEDGVWAARLEVGGSLSGGGRTLNKYMRNKLRQTRRSDSSGLPAYAVIVGFGEPAALLRRRTP